MTELLKKEKKFIWTDECEASFQELKQRLVSASVLCLLDINKDFQVYCDASRQVPLVGSQHLQKRRLSPTGR